MKSLVLAVVLFCSLAALLGYVATSGIGVRIPSGPPVVVDRTAQLEAKPVVPEIEVKAQRLPTESKPEQVPTLKKPEAPIVVKRPRRRQPRPVEPEGSTAPTVRPQPAVRMVERTASPKRAVAPAPTPRRQEPVHETPRPAETVIASAPRPAELEPDKETLQRQIDEDRKWRRSVLDRWAKEERERKAKEREAIKNEFDANGRLKPRDESEKDLEPAANVDKPKKKKKRHRFLMIRW